MAKPRLVVIDDFDTRIRYSEGWEEERSDQFSAVGTNGPPLYSTMHSISGSGSFQFDFTGTGIMLSGMSIGLASDTPDHRWVCHVDSRTIPSSPPPPNGAQQNQWTLCEVSGLPDGPHTLTVDIATSRKFYFDYLRYTPSHSVSTGNEVVWIPNTDAGLRFDSSWRGFQPTGNITLNQGSVFSFEFVGTSLAWYGMLLHNHPRRSSFGSYMINASELTEFTIPGLEPTVNTTLFNQQFFHTGLLPLGTHHIFVTYRSNGRRATPLTLDYLLVQNATGPGRGIGVTSATGGPRASSGTANGTSNSKSTPVGLIAGLVCGLLGLLLVVGLGVVFYRRRKAEKDLDRAASGVDIIEPFTSNTRRRNRGHTDGFSPTTPSSEARLYPIPVPMRDFGQRITRYARSVWSSSASSAGGSRSDRLPGLSNMAERERDGQMREPLVAAATPPLRTKSGRLAVANPSRDASGTMEDLAPRPGASRRFRDDMSASEKSDDEDGDRSYCGGITTRAQVKALEAAAEGRGRRDSYC